MAALRPSQGSGALAGLCQELPPDQLSYHYVALMSFRAILQNPLTDKLIRGIIYVRKEIRKKSGGAKMAKLWLYRDRYTVSVDKMDHGIYAAFTVCGAGGHASLSVTLTRADAIDMARALLEEAGVPGLECLRCNAYVELPVGG